MFLELPEEIQLKILLYVVDKIHKMVRLRLVCKKWNELLDDREIWRALCFLKYNCRGLLQCDLLHFKNIHLLVRRFTLTAEEKEMIKKQRRVIKNREYSQNSRQKKKQRVEDLEARISQIEDENQRLKKENNALKSKLLTIASIYKQNKLQKLNHSNHQQTNNYMNNNNAAAAAAHQNQSISSSSSSSSSLFSIKSTNQKAMVGCFFIILLSFGFFITNQNSASLSNVSKSSRVGGRVVFSASEDYSTPSSSSSSHYYYYYQYYASLLYNFFSSFWNQFFSPFFESDNLKVLNDNNVNSKSFEYQPSVVYYYYTEVEQRDGDLNHVSSHTYDYDDSVQCDFVPSHLPFYFFSPFYNRNFTSIDQTNAC